MEDVTFNLIESLKKRGRYDIDIWELDKDKDYIVYSGLVFEDGEKLWEFVHEYEGGDFDTIEELEDYYNGLDTEVKKGKDIIRDEIESK